MSAAEHHAKFCLSRGIGRMAPLERCPFRAWHTSQEPRVGYPQRRPPEGYTGRQSVARRREMGQIVQAPS